MASSIPHGGGAVGSLVSNSKKEGDSQVLSDEGSINDFTVKKNPFEYKQ